MIRRWAERPAILAVRALDATLTRLGPTASPPPHTPPPAAETPDTPPPGIAEEAAAWLEEHTAWCACGTLVRTPFERRRCKRCTP